MQLNILLSNVASFMKRRLIELFGLILIALCFLFTFTLAFYSPENTTLIYKAEGAQAVNIFYYYSNVTADFFLQSFGLMSFVIGICILSWGINLIINNSNSNRRVIKNELQKIKACFVDKKLDAVKINKLLKKRICM